MSKLFLALALVFAVTGCGTTPAQRVYNAHLAYDAALSAAVAYKEAPGADKTVVATLQRADNVAFEALKSAQTIVRQPKQESAWATAAMWAQEAVAAFARTVATVKRGS